MMSIYIKYKNYIVRMEDGACIPIDESNCDYQSYLAWVDEGNTADPPPAATFADYAATFMGNFTAWIADVVRANNYDSPESCASYVTSGIAQFKQDAISFIAWRDALWIWAANWQNGFNGELPSTIPTWDEVKAQAPQPEAFGWVVHAKGLNQAA